MIIPRPGDDEIGHCLDACPAEWRRVGDWAGGRLGVSFRIQE